MDQILGYDEAGSGPVLLLVHGFPLDRTMWSEQLKGLADIRRVIAVDLPGRGVSENVKRDSLEGYSEALAQLLDHLGVDRVDLAGLSMGGYVAFTFQNRYPDRVRSLILIDTKAAADNQEAKQGREKTAAMVRENGTLALEDTLLPKLFGPEASEEVKGQVRSMFGRTPSETAATDALAMKDRPEFSLSSLDLPVLVVHGQDDQLMPVSGAEEMARNIAGAKFVAIPGAGHMSPMENAESVNQALRDFLSSLG